jgi:glycosyltransferase involved in cell wall biosynthesis
VCVSSFTCCLLSSSLKVVFCLRFCDVFSLVCARAELKDKLEEKTMSLSKNDHVFLDGFISKDEISQWYALKDVYIHNSNSEGHCVSILQTMSCGLPVLSTDVGGTSETLPQDWVYSADDPLDLKHKLRWFFGLSLEERSKIGKKNREKTEEDFDLTKQT